MYLPFMRFDSQLARLQSVVEGIYAHHEENEDLGNDWEADVRAYNMILTENDKSLVRVPPRKHRARQKQKCKQI